MTDRNTDSDGSTSRRSFMRDGAIASGGLALGLSASGVASAQTDDNGTATEDSGGDDGVLENSAQGLITTGNVYPAARFAFVSGVVEWVPNYGDVQDSWFADYNTYLIRWLNTGNVVPFWVADDADLGEYDADLGFIPDDEEQDQPQLYEMNRGFAPFGDNPELTEVEFSPVEEEAEDSILENDDWWQESGDPQVAEDGDTVEADGNETAQNGTTDAETPGTETADDESDGGVVDTETIGNETDTS